MKIRLNPPQILVLGFAGVILLGAFLLMLPISSRAGVSTDFLTAIFTSTSAVCVTGLVVVDTGVYWSTFGQMIILLLVQVGGLGFMTFAVLFALILGRRIGLKERIILKEALNKLDVSGVVRLVKSILKITILLELIGAILLTLYWKDLLGLPKALYYGLFHSVTAFNNAGFDLFGPITGEFTSLTFFKVDPFVSLIIGFLIIAGGIGFGVIIDLLRKRNFSRLTLNSKIVLLATMFLLLLGCLGFLLLEYNNPSTLKNLSFGGKLTASFFQGVTPRTAGFNSLDLLSLEVSTVFMIIILMFIGASPGSTGGGIKTTTLVAFFAFAKGTLAGQREVSMFNKKLPNDLLAKSVTLTFLASLWIAVVTLILTITEGKDFLVLLFETTSAFATVGLSLGLTPALTAFGKVLIMLTMFIGRLGPLTLFYLMVIRKKESKLSYPEERILIG